MVQVVQAASTIVPPPELQPAKFTAPAKKVNNEADGVNPNWFIDTTALGCGLVTFVGWSSGVGIDAEHNQKCFEQDMFKLLFWSSRTRYDWDCIYPEDYPGKKNASNVAYTDKKYADATFTKVSVALKNFNFLPKTHTILLSSKVEWIERFQKFVKDHDLGEFTISHIFVNKYWRQNELLNATWTWNGKVPDPKKCGIKTWEY